MLNYFLAKVTNKKFQDLLLNRKSLKKVFKVDEILKQLLIIYLNLSVFKFFIKILRTNLKLA